MSLSYHEIGWCFLTYLLIFFNLVLGFLPINFAWHCILFRGNYIKKLYLLVLSSSIYFSHCSSQRRTSEHIWLPLQKLISISSDFLSHHIQLCMLLPLSYKKPGPSSGFLQERLQFFLFVTSRETGFVIWRNEGVVSPLWELLRMFCKSNSNFGHISVYILVNETHCINGEALIFCCFSNHM